MWPVVLALLALPFLLAAFVIYALWEGGAWLMRFISRRREARIARIEAELDRTQEELRRTILQLADALGAEAHQARKALIHESFIASGRVPGKE